MLGHVISVVNRVPVAKRASQGPMIVEGKIMGSIQYSAEKRRGDWLPGKVGHRALEHSQVTPQQVCCHARSAPVKGYTVEFQVLVVTRCVEYLRPETHRAKMFEMTLDF